ncbi:hypothetical protein SLS62_005527 [Diatrype stigma]|uniref:Enoyl reductase (ER) domain-containing protein n=1 Tax=Diatrype stigma TaxID=117547 RepID=A0AAN9UP43_9PEZI
MPRILTIRKSEGKPGQVYYPLEFQETPDKPVPGPGEVLVRMRAAALNHRDHFIRQHLYPGIGFGVPMLADGVGIVEALGPDDVNSSPSPSKPKGGTGALLHKRVLLTPMRGWAADPVGPEDERRFAVAGGGRNYPDVGYGRDWAAVPASEVEPCPEHLSDAEAAALPLVGLTAWRALVTKANLGLCFSRDDKEGKGKERKNILVTGIGGGVALAALQFAVGFGTCDVWVTSSSTSKIERAVALGAKGGVLYRDDNNSTSTTWDKKLATQLPPGRPYLDAVIDGAGGDVVARAALRLLRPGGVVVSYGMTLGPKMDWLMGAVLRNVELRGTTMGSRAEFADMVAFVKARRIVPVVSRVVRASECWGQKKREGEGDVGYDFAAIEGLFADIRAGRHFGKLVIEISTAADDEDGDKKIADKTDAKL